MERMITLMDVTYFSLGLGSNLMRGRKGGVQENPGVYLLMG